VLVGASHAHLHVVCQSWHRLTDRKSLCCIFLTTINNPFDLMLIQALALGLRVCESHRLATCYLDCHFL
jgi:hypothetical protein